MSITILAISLHCQSQSISNVMQAATLVKSFNTGEAMMELTLPLTKEKAKTLKVGDILFLTGFAYTCRDAAHKKSK